MALTETNEQEELLQPEPFCVFYGKQQVQVLTAGMCHRYRHLYRPMAGSLGVQQEG
jgi:hypothetical protein